MYEGWAITGQKRTKSLAMLLLADENFPYSSFNYLKEQGYDIKHIGELDMGINDEEVIQLSIDEGRVITTFDSDFGELIFKHSLKAIGVIYFRWKEFKPREPCEYLHELLQEGALKFEGYLTVIDHRQIRQRKI